MDSVYEMRKAGMTFREIGERLGISKQQSHKIYRSRGAITYENLSVVERAVQSGAYVYQIADTTGLSVEVAQRTALALVRQGRVRRDLVLGAWLYKKEPED